PVSEDEAKAPVPAADEEIAKKPVTPANEDEAKAPVPAVDEAPAKRPTAQEDEAKTSVATDDDAKVPAAANDNEAEAKAKKADDARKPAVAANANEPADTTKPTVEDPQTVQRRARAEEVWDQIQAGDREWTGKNRAEFIQHYIDGWEIDPDATTRRWKKP